MANLTAHHFFDASKPNEISHRILSIMDINTAPTSEHQYLRIGQSNQWFKSSPYQIADRSNRTYKDCFEWDHITIDQVPANILAAASLIIQD
jgi:hypothetical protein